MISLMGERDLLAYAVNAKRPEDLVLRLFVNDYTPTDADDASAFVEAEGYGYQPKVLRGASWSIEEVARYPEQTFLFTGAMGWVYGYYLTRAKSNRLASASRFFDGPYEIAVAGDRVRVNAKLEFKRLLTTLTLRVNKEH